MSVNTNRAKLKKANNNREYQKLLYLDLYGAYWDWDYNWKCKDFSNTKGRSYKTWKHNRKTKWK
jgi:hypothetical protein